MKKESENGTRQPTGKSSMLITSICLLVAGVALLALSLFGDPATPDAKWYLPGALLCVIAANVLTLILIRRKRKG